MSAATLRGVCRSLLPTLVPQCALQCLHIVEMASLELTAAATRTNFIPARTFTSHVEHFADELPDPVIAVRVLSPKVSSGSNQSISVHVGQTIQERDYKFVNEPLNC